MIKAQIMSKPIKSHAVYGQKALSKEGPEIALSLSFWNFPFRTRSSLFDKVNEIIAKIEQGFHTGRDIVKELNIRHQRVLSHLTEAAYKKKLDTEMPHELTQNNWLGLQLRENFKNDWLQGIKSGSHTTIVYK